MCESLSVVVGDAIVTSDDARATKEHAQAVAEVFAKYWLKDHPDNEPVYTRIGDVIYKAVQCAGTN